MIKRNGSVFLNNDIISISENAALVMPPPCSGVRRQTNLDRWRPDIRDSSAHQV